ncbi:MAG: flippase-like domain-containing protein [Candidatus Omnitrophica bacterium]|nr:flippase-like domain-containing protein [Candidatus Omnitrophota bacterium]
MKKHIFLISRVAVTLIIILILWYFLKENAGELGEILSSANKYYLFAGFFLFIVNVLLLSLRLKVVLSTQKLKLNFTESLRLNFIAFFFNSFLPTAVGGDIAKAYYASEKFKKKKVECYTAVFADRTIGLMSIVSIAIAALFIAGADIIPFKMRFFIFAVFGLAVFFVVFSLNHRLAQKFKFLISLCGLRKIEEPAQKIYGVLNDFGRHKRASLFAFLIAFGGQVLIITVCFIISKSLHLQVNYSIFFLFIPIISAASMIPSLGGTGPREFAFVLLFGSLVDRAEAAALALMWLFYLLCLSLIGGVVYLLSGYHKLTISEIEKEISYDKQRVA